MKGRKENKKIKKSVQVQRHHREFVYELAPHNYAYPGLMSNRKTLMKMRIA